MRMNEITKPKTQYNVPPVLINAEYAGRCSDCTGDIFKGERVWWSPTKKTMTHTSCALLADQQSADRIRKKEMSRKSEGLK